MSRALLILVALAALVRLPFLNQAFQLDDYYYLKAAQHALADPLHPHHARYVFLGIEFDMRGHPHPPGNAWMLMGLLAVFGAAKEVPLHLAWALFTVGAAWAAYAAAKRLCPESALDVAVLACSAPVFVTAGNALFTDLPFICFWTWALALGLGAGEKRWNAWGCMASLAAAAVISYQAVFAIPILAVFWRRRGWLRELWWVLTVPAIVIGGYMLFEKLTGGPVPAQVLAGHFKTFGLQRPEMKLKNAAALTAHLAWMASPVLILAMAKRLKRRLWAIPLLALGVGIPADGSPLFWLPLAAGVTVLTWIALQEDAELKLWFGLYFAGALAVFFAGAARYMLPAMLPLALLAGRAYGETVAAPGAAAFNLALGLALAWVNLQHWGAYRELAADWLPKQGRVWVNAEWGLREYAERRGARPLLRGTTLEAGDWLISSALAEQIGYSMPGLDPQTVAQAMIRPALPLRLIGLGARSAFETVGYGLRPFDVTTAPVDVVTLTRFDGHAPELSWLRMADPGANSQITAGVYPGEHPEWRWMARTAAFELKNPGGPVRLRAECFVPEEAPGRVVELLLDGRVVASRRLPGPGPAVLESGELTPAGGSVKVELRIDRDFSPGGPDRRRLGMILSAIGFAPSKEPPAPPPPARR